jgi:ketosteroid isomerase-like protein
MTTLPGTFLTRLVDATNSHDLDALVDCFAEDYRNDTPAHPARSFVGRAQVETNWRSIFSFVPDLRARVLASVVEGDVAWSEWEMTGTRRDGSAHRMSGAIVFGVRDGRAQWARFYLEPVDESGGNVDHAVQRQVHAAPPWAGPT